MDLKQKVLDRILPEEKERQESQQMFEKIKDFVSEEFGLEAGLMGSLAKDTFLSGDKDLDIFVFFPESTGREELEEKGLEIGKKVFEHFGGEFEVEYAEHPYINTKINGFDIDIVPCYDIEDPSEPKSSVDRTPHHQKYIGNKLENDQTNEVLLLKKFLKGIGAYGSELKVHGFSGYLSELLIIQYETFDNLIESAREWGKIKVINPKNNRSAEDLKKAFPEDPLILMDPVDPSRNVAAALSKKNYAKFVRAAESFSQNPNKKFFNPDPALNDKETMKEKIKERESKIFLINLDIKEDIVPDILYPQLRKTKRKLRNKLERKEFKIIRSQVWAKENKAVLLIELEYPKISKVKTHEGPPLGISAKPFLNKHKNSEENVAGPYINKEGKMVFELEREYTEAEEVLKEALNSREGLGNNIEKAIEKNGFEITQDENTVQKVEQVGGIELLGEYLDKRVPWQR